MGQTDGRIVALLRPSVPCRRAGHNVAVASCNSVLIRV